MIITISGLPGAGKSTVAQLLAKKLHLQRHYLGGIRREMARRQGITIDELNRRSENDPSSDRVVDAYVKRLARSDNSIVESRTAFHFIPHSLKVFLTVDLREAARRISHDLQAGSSRNETPYRNEQEALIGLRRRIASDRRRLKKFYGFDCYDKNNYDLLIDTTSLSPEETTQAIVRFLSQSAPKALIERKRKF